MATTPESGSPEVPESRPRNLEERARSGCVVLLFGWLCLFGLGLALAARDVAERYAPVVVGAAVLFLGAKAVADALRKWANAPLLPVATATGVVLMAVALAAVARDAIGAQLAELGESPRITAAFAGEHLSASRALAFAAGVVLVPMVGAGLGMGLARVLGRPTLARWLGVAAAAATGLCALLVLLGGVRSLLRPSLDDELRRLRASTETLAAPGVPRDVDMRDGRGRPMGVKKVIESGPAGVRRTALWADLTVVQVCATDGCRVGFLDGTGATASAEDVPDPAPFQRWDEALLVTRDRDSDTLYLRPQGGRVRAELHHVHGLWVPMGFSAGDIAHGSAPPRAWLLVGLLGLAALAGLSWRGLSAKKRAAALASAAGGVLGEDGWIALEGGETARLDGQASIPAGPVVVLGSRAGNSAYRDRPLSARDVLPGTLAELRAQALLGRILADAFLLAAGVLFAAPLAAAVPAGLVVPLGGGGRAALGVASTVPPAIHARPPVDEPVPAPAAGMSWRFRAVDVVDVNHDGTDDAIGDCELPHSGVSGPIIEMLPCAIDGRTMHRLWRGPSSGIGGQGVIARAGDRVLVTASGDQLRSLDVATGKSGPSFAPPDRGREACVADPDRAVVWLGWSGAPGAEIDLHTGTTVPAPRPAACASRWISPCPGGLDGLCGSAPTVAETATLQEQNLTPVALFRTPQAVVVVANEGAHPAAGRTGGPMVAGLDPRTSARLYLVDIPRDGKSGEAGGAAAVIGGVLFVTYATREGHLAAFEPQTGRFHWDFKVESYAARPPMSFLLSQGRIFVPTRAGLAVIDAYNGVQIGTMDGT